jgi:hypothetical protein
VSPAALQVANPPGSSPEPQTLASMGKFRESSQDKLKSPLLASRARRRTCSVPTSGQRYLQLCPQMKLARNAGHRTATQWIIYITCLLSAVHIPPGIQTSIIVPNSMELVMPLSLGTLSVARILFGCEDFGSFVSLAGASTE